MQCLIIEWLYVWCLVWCTLCKADDGVLLFKWLCRHTNKTPLFCHLLYSTNAEQCHHNHHRWWITITTIITTITTSALIIINNQKINLGLWWCCDTTQCDSLCFKIGMIIRSLPTAPCWVSLSWAGIDPRSSRIRLELASYTARVADILKRFNQSWFKKKTYV